jgi:hypothetical protein
VTYQLGAASQGNLVSLFLAIGTSGEMWDEREIEEVIGAAVIGGSRSG